jgi:S1-C subfamily serine protease
VLSLEPEGPAAKAGVLIGDILTSLGGSKVADTDDIQVALESHAVGKPVAAIVSRGGVSQSIDIVVGERPRRG